LDKRNIDVPHVTYRCPNFDDSAIGKI